MSYLDKLLEGVQVEWKRLEEVAKFRRGSFPQPYGKSQWYDGEGAMPFVQVVDVGSDMRLVRDTKNKISKLAQPKSVFVPKDSVIVTLQGSIGRVAITQYDSYVDRTLAIFEEFQIDIYKKYFAYQLEEKFKIEKENARGSTIKTITKEEFKKFQIPIPPLAIQKEIIRTLDNLTELTNELTTKLDKELKIRKKQYEYYRDELFSFKKAKTKYGYLSDIGVFQRGKRFVKTDIVAVGVPCIHYGEMYTHYGVWASNSKSFLTNELFESKKLRVAERGDVIIVAAGETIEDIGKGTAWLGEEGVVIHDACFSYRSSLNSKYVAYFTRTKHFHDQIKKHISSGKISAINSKGLEKVLIPIPSPEEQERIVKILDEFNAITKSITEELTKEIVFRNKQYQYYRDLLLNFPKNNVIA